mmetsp:Transcript_5548/g.6705  ORF Transcript_5548/g.6705 Transcript_5548/m.6705 type:complete len:273 (+) Transcript_5548:219-1037(+)
MAKIDLFARQAAAYAVFRPTYPETAVRFILDEVKAAAGATQLQNACDLGCGNGQVTVPVSQTGWFKQVIGTDISAKQLKEAPQDIPNLRFMQADATNLAAVGVRDHSCSLVTAAQMMHWMTSDRDTWSKMKNELVRVLVPGEGRCAILGYGMCKINNDVKLNDLFQNLYTATLNEGLWDESCDRRLLDRHFEETLIDFSPLRVVKRKAFPTDRRMPLASFVQYVNTWSAFSQTEKGTNLYESFIQEPYLVENIEQEVSVQFPFFAILLKTEA